MSDSPSGVHAIPPLYIDLPKPREASLRSGPPTAGIRKTPEAASELRLRRVKAMNRPSGDHAGVIAPEGSCVSWTGVSVPTTFTYRSKRSLLSPPFQEKEI